MILQDSVNSSKLLMINPADIQVIEVFPIGRCFKQSWLPHVYEVFWPVHQVFDCWTKPFRLLVLTWWWDCSLRL